MKRRRAVSLVELLLAMSACTVILTMSASLIHRVMHAQSKTRAFCDGERTSLRLAGQFRRDVHEAIDAVASEVSLADGVILRLTLPSDQTVEYRRSLAAVSRVLLTSGAARSHEQYVFPADIDVLVRKESPRLIRLSITSQSNESAHSDGRPRALAYAVPVSLQAQAVLARHSERPANPAGERGAP